MGRGQVSACAAPPPLSIYASIYLTTYLSLYRHRPNPTHNHNPLCLSLYTPLLVNNPIVDLLLPLCAALAILTVNDASSPSLTLALVWQLCECECVCVCDPLEAEEAYSETR